MSYQALFLPPRWLKCCRYTTVRRQSPKQGVHSGSQVHSLSTRMQREGIENQGSTSLPFPPESCVLGREGKGRSGAVGPGLIWSECQSMEKAFLGRFRPRSLRQRPSLTERRSWLVHTGLFDGGCEYIHFTWGEPGIKYLLCPGREAH